MDTLLYFLCSFNCFFHARARTSVHKLNRLETDLSSSTYNIQYRIAESFKYVVNANKIFEFASPRAKLIESARDLIYAKPFRGII